MLSLVDVHIVRTGGSNNFSLSYGRSKRDVVCEIACAHFSSETAGRRDLKLCTMLHYHKLVNMHIVLDLLSIHLVPFSIHLLYLFFKFLEFFVVGLDVQDALVGFVAVEDSSIGLHCA